VFEQLRLKPSGTHVFLYAFDLLELDGQDLRREPLETRKATLASLLRRSLPGLRHRVPLEPTPDGLGVKVIASTYQRRGLGLQSDGARCYNSQEFYG
jgi:hypothetical protein